jgi:hypothetical protein
LSFFQAGGRSSRFRCQWSSFRTGSRRTIRERFRIKADVPEIRRADRALLATERRAFSAESWHWPELEGVEPLDLELAAWRPTRPRARSPSVTPSSTLAADGPIGRLVSSRRRA